MNDNKECYGQFKSKSKKDIKECENCWMKDWCEAASDPALIGIVDEKCVENKDVTPAPTLEQDRLGGNMLQAFMCSLRSELSTLLRLAFYDYSHRERFIIMTKLEKPEASLNEIGKGLGIAKQQVNRHIDKLCKELPALEAILRNRADFNKWRNRPQQVIMGFDKGSPEGDHTSYFHAPKHSG